MKAETLGAIGEKRAAAYLQACGYTVLESNWRVGHKEIDIICTDGDRIIVVEVKTRRAGVDYPAELMDRKKKHNLLKAGAVYLQRYGLEKRTALRPGDSRRRERTCPTHPGSNTDF